MSRETFDKILIDILWGTPSLSLGVFSRDELRHSYSRCPSANVPNTNAGSLPVEYWFAF